MVLRYLLAGALSVSSTVALAQNERLPLSGVDAEGRLPHTLAKVVRPPALGGKPLEVYKDPSDDGRRYFVKPYFLVHWDTFEHSVEKACGDAQGPDSIAVRLPYEVGSKQVTRQIVAELNETLADDAKVGIGDMYSFPFAIFTITYGSVNSGLPTTLQHIYPPDALQGLYGGTIANTTSIPEQLGQLPAFVEADCETLEKIVLHRDLHGSIYSKRLDIKRNALQARLDQFATSKAMNDLFRGETQQGEIVTRSESAGAAVGISIGGLFGAGSGGSESTSRSQDTRMRTVTSDIIEKAARDFSEGLSISEWVEAEREAGGVDKIREILISFLTSRATPVVARFEPPTENDLHWKLVAGERERQVSQADVERLMKSANNPEIAASKKTAASAGEEGPSVSNDRAMTYKDQRQIEWNFNGTEWVPTSVTLYALSQEDIKGSVTANFESAIVARSDEIVRHYLEPIVTTQDLDAEFAEREKALQEEHEEHIAVLRTPPEKQVIPLQAGAYKTTQYWSKGSQSKVKHCIQDPEQPSGMIKVGAGEKGRGPMWTKDGLRFGGALDSISSKVSGAAQAIVGQQGGCRDPGFCDSAGEWCISHFRDPGCYVSKEWHDWYVARKRDLGEPVDVKEICS